MGRLVEGQKAKQLRLALGLRKWQHLRREALARQKRLARSHRRFEPQRPRQLDGLALCSQRRPCRGSEGAVVVPGYRKRTGLVNQSHTAASGCHQRSHQYCEDAVRLPIKARGGQELQGFRYEYATALCERVWTL